MDPRTLTIVYNFISDGLVLLAFLLWQSGKMYPGFGRWTLGRTLISAFSLLQILSGVWPDWIINMSLSATSICGLVLNLQACREFLGMRFRVRWIFIAAALLFLAQVYLSLVAHAFRIFYATGSASASAFYFACAATLLGSGAAARNRPREFGLWVTGLSFAAVAVTYAVLALNYVVRPAGGVLLGAGLPFNSVRLSLILTAIAVNFGFFLMNYERLLKDREEQAGLTERARMEQEKAALEVKLLQAQKMESIGRLAGGVAHDFNNMLTVILGYAAMSRQTLPPDAPQLKYLSEIEKAGTRSKEITQKLLGFSRQQIISPVPSNLNDLAEDLREPLARLIGEDVELTFDPGKGLSRVVVDPSQVNQILLNLAVNARDAMPNGGKLTIETANVMVSEEYCRTQPDVAPGPYVLLAVSDTGTGMDDQTLARIFEPFFTTKGPDKGTGLGLATVYGIVKQNRGFVNVYSEPGHGTTFRIYIPPMEGEAPAPEVIVRTAAPNAGSGTILLVEDDDLVREMTVEALVTIGYTPLIAKNPREALELCATQGSGVRLMLSDVVMPGMNGMELRDRIWATHPEIKVLFMSGYSANVIVKHGVLKAGVNLINKPFTVEELGRRVAETLAGTSV